MPQYVWLLDKKIDTSSTLAKIRAMRTLGVPYPKGYESQALNDVKQQEASIAKDLNDNGVPVNGNEEIIALIAYLQRLGTDIKQPQTTDNAK